MQRSPTTLVLSVNISTIFYQQPHEFCDIVGVSTPIGCRPKEKVQRRVAHIDSRIRVSTGSKQDRYRIDLYAKSSYGQCRPTTIDLFIWIMAASEEIMQQFVVFILYSIKYGCEIPFII